jgi:hypothetical protein
VVKRSPEIPCGNAKAVWPGNEEGAGGMMLCLRPRPPPAAAAARSGDDDSSLPPCRTYLTTSVPAAPDPSSMDSRTAWALQPAGGG